ncbi:hypothetical protein BCON_0031g00580 [Botryotinia convoluta]|uniref:Uncharacterized protein n=1 Tax=Botryotinia convoluta TaxID=54673 RepID=A0A4Z1IH61_9HELO|nr:hypothetical protein BCON_0031g00580 [Botryotinia convoluta]
MSSAHPIDPEDPKPIPIAASIITSNLTSSQSLTDNQPSQKPPLRPNAPTSLPSSILSVPSGTGRKVSSGDRSFNPRSRQLCVVDIPGLRTPPQGYSLQYSQKSPFSTAPISRHALQSDYFEGCRPSTPSRSRGGHGKSDLVSSMASPLLPTEGSPMLASSSKNSHIGSFEYSCTTDSMSSIRDRIVAPYKARKLSSESLTMVKKHGRRNTEGMGKKRKHRCRGTCNQGLKRGAKKIAAAERDYNSHWLPPTQVAPTALEGAKLPNTRKDRCLPKRLGKRRLMSEPAAPIISRRWSSVEIGTRQLKLRPLLKPNSGQHVQGDNPKTRNAFFDSNPLGERNRSSSFTAGARYNDMVRSLRDRLTIRKVTNRQMLKPSAITLRRPSASNKSDMSSTMGTSPFLTTPGTMSGIPSISSRQPTYSENLPQDSEAYIITREDVEAVMELLQAGLLHTHEGRPPVSAANGSSQDQSPRGSRLSSLSFTSKGVVPIVRPSSCEIHIHSAQSDNSKETSQLGNSTTRTFSPNLPHSPTWIVNPEISGNPKSFLGISQSNFGRLDRQSEGDPESVHEVIWEEHGQQESHLSERDHVHFEGESKCSSQASTDQDDVASPGHDDTRKSFHHRENPDQEHRSSKNKGTFDPTDARMSISKWSWQCEPAVNGDDANFITITEQESLKDHVISFPPLPRKSTNEWRSPLPDISIPIRESRLLGDILSKGINARPSHSLYSIGIDARTAMSSPMLSGMATTPITRSSWLNETAISPPDRVCSWLSNFEADALKRQKSDAGIQRKKSIIKAHPKAPARSGNATAIGSSLGSCTGVRRCASSQTLSKLRKVTIFDSLSIESNHCKGKKSWFKHLQNAAFPKSNTESGAEPASFWSTLATRNSSKDPVTRSIPSPPTSPHGNLKDGKKASHNIQPVISPDMSETISAPRSSARQSLSLIQDKYIGIPQVDLNLYLPKRNSSSPRISAARESLLKIQARFPSLPKPDHSGIYDTVTGIQRKNKVECLKDCRHLLHTCDDSACGSNMSSPSVDWIG